MTRQTERMSQDSTSTSAPTTGPLLAAAEGSGSLSRRSVLGMAAVTGAVGLLAACGGSSNDETTEPAASDSAGASDGASSPAAGGGALAKTADVPVAGGAVNEAQKVVVTQPTAGQFKAFTATCTHQACLVTSVSNGTINCPCHGSQYSAADGSVKRGPATSPLREIAVKVEGDAVVKA
jgi:Rieske Fe-S protein